MVCIEHIKKQYKNHSVLRDITFSAQPGDCIGILGKNGCGKSTLLSILAGALRPNSGQITYHGQDPLSSPNLFRKMVGYVPQENPFIEELSVLDNLLLWYPDSKKELETRLLSGSLSFFHLYEIRKQKVSKLSGGMKKRLSIACSLAYDPRIFILDEPTSALDLSCKLDIRNWMKDHLAKGGILILSSHEEEDFSLITHPYHLADGVLTPLPADQLSQSLKERLAIHEPNN